MRHQEKIICIEECAGRWTLDAPCDRVHKKNEEEWWDGAFLMNTNRDTNRFLKPNERVPLELDGAAKHTRLRYGR